MENTPQYELLLYQNAPEYTMVHSRIRSIGTKHTNVRSSWRAIALLPVGPSRPHAGIKGVPQSVTQEVVRDHGEDDEDPGKEQPR